MTAVQTPLPPAVQATSPAGLAVRGATLAFDGTPILRGADLSVAPGRTVALLGPSGCGKTTLLRAVAGLQALDGGQVVLDGHDVTHTRAERRGVGMVFQDGALFPHMDIAGNVGFGLDRAARRSGAVADALQMVGLGGMEDRMPATLSGGQQQRVALARALVAKPRILLLDEPFSSLDAGLRTQVRTDVARLLDELGITAVVVTHDQEEAFLLGDEVAVMIDGRIHQQAPPAEVYAAPASREVAVFLGDANLVPGRADGQHADTALGRVPLDRPSRGSVDVLVRPEHLRMRGDGRHAVVAVEYYGHDAVTRIRDLDGRELRIRTMSLPPYGQGEQVGVDYTGPATVAYPRA